LLKATWEVFSGFGTTASVTATAREKAASQDTYQYNRRKIDEELRITWEQLQTARERVKLLTNAAVIAEEVLVARKRLRDSGKETAINVLDAETELFRARINTINARFDVEVAAFRVLFAMGMLTAETLGL
jgi:adhesin transport system outer membrane protein